MQTVYTKIFIEKFYHYLWKPNAKMYVNICQGCIGKGNSMVNK